MERQREWTTTTWRAGSASSRQQARAEEVRTACQRAPKRPPLERLQSVRIALLGTRGIPANYGGFETFAEELSARLGCSAATRYGLLPRTPIPSPATAASACCTFLPFATNTSTPWPTRFFSTLHLLAHRVDVALYCNAANAMFTILPRILGIPVALNVDGIERKRKKWNALARAWYRSRSGWLRCCRMVGDRCRGDRAVLSRKQYRKDSVIHSLWRRHGPRRERRTHWTAGSRAAAATSSM